MRLTLLPIIASVCLIAPSAIAAPITGTIGFPSYSYSGPPPGVLPSVNMTNGTYTLQVQTQQVGLPSSGCEPTQLNGTSTGIWFGACTYNPSFAISWSGSALSSPWFNSGFTLFQGNTVIAQLTNNQWISGDQTTVVNLVLNGAGLPFLNQPSTTALVNPQGVSTSYSNVQLALTGSIEVRIGGACVWCQSISGTSVASGGAAIGSSFSQSLRRDEFTASEVPEPSTFSAVALCGGVLAAGIRLANARRRAAQGSGLRTT